MNFGRGYGKRDNFVTATIGTLAEDAFGNVTQTNSSDDTITFWAGVMDQKSARSFEEGKRYDNTMKTLSCDSRDVEDLTIDHRIQVDNRATTFSIIDIYDSEFKYESHIIIKAQN